MRAALLVLLVVVGGSALAQDKVDPAVVGTWAAPMPGFTMTFKIDASGRCSLDDEPGTCTARGGTLTYRGPEGSERYQYQVRGNQLIVSGGDMEMAIAFNRKGGAPQQQQEVAKVEPAPAQKAPPPEQQPTAAPPPKGGGPSFSKDLWGVKFSAPGGWKLAERDGMVLLGSDTEAGLILVRYYYQLTREQMLAEYQKGLHEDGVSAMPTGPAVDWKGGAASGVAGELSGTSKDGAQVRVRTIGLPNSYGGGLVVVGLTTAEKYPTLKARTEQLAATVAFQKPKETQGAGLAGAYAYIYVSKVGSYSREAYLTLCRSGRFTRRGEMIGSAELSGGARGNAFAGSNNAGTWKAHGDPNSGTLILHFGDGSSAQVNYRTSHNPKDRSAYGPAVKFGNDLYQKTGSGDC